MTSSTGGVVPENALLRPIDSVDLSKVHVHALFNVQIHNDDKKMAPPQSSSRPRPVHVPAAPLFVSPRNFHDTVESVRQWSQPTVIGCGAVHIRTLLERASLTWPSCVFVWVVHEVTDQVIVSRAGGDDHSGASPNTQSELDVLCARVSTCNLVRTREYLRQVPDLVPILCITYGDAPSHARLQKWRQRQLHGLLFVIEKTFLEDIDRTFADQVTPFVVHRVRGRLAMDVSEDKK